MAAYTQTTTGNWSSTATWGGTGPPGSGDTATISLNITVDVNTTVGSSPSTGGTPAITYSASSPGAVTLTIATGVTLTCKGDILIQNQYVTAASLTMSSGSTLTLLPPSGQQYKINCADPNFTDSIPTVTVNGTSGSHCKIQTNTSSGGLQGYLSVGAANANQGLITATYLDVVDMGDSTHAGIQTHTDRPSNTNVSITHCTFTGSGYSADLGVSGPWDGNFTFQYNSFSSSVGTVINGYSACAGFSFGSAASSGTRLIDTCSFDLEVANGSFIDCTLSNTIIQGLFSCLTGSTWPSASYFTNILSYSPSSPSIDIFGPIENVYLYSTQSSNPHYVFVDNSVTAATVAGLIVESGGTLGEGDVVFPQTTTTGSPTLKVTNCIVLPDASGDTSGKLVSNVQANNAKVTVIAEHNTYFAGPSNTDGNSSVVALGENSGDYLAEITSCRANLAWYTTTGTGCFASFDDSPSPVADTVTLAGYNWFWNPTSGTCVLNAISTSTPGYGGLKCSTAGFPSTQLGTGDQSGNPSFVDHTRNLANWGGTAAGGGTATVAAAIAQIVANPALIGQATTGLLAWVRAGFRPTNPGLQASSYPGDASPSDAAGNSWPTGSPGIGAMAYQSASVPAISQNPFPALPPAILAI